MRAVLSTLVVLMIAATLGMVGQHMFQVRRDRCNRQITRAELARFQRQVHLQAALTTERGNEPHYPPSIDPKWFEGHRPRNALLGPDHPWVEIASDDQEDLLHPPDLTADGPAVAAFWYNPASGAVRARVPRGISDASALALYNQVNDTALAAR